MLFLKKEIRKKVLEQRNQMTKGEIVEKSGLITEKLIGFTLYQKADWIFTYVNMGTEVETMPFIEKAWREGKKVAVPIAVRGSREMYFVEIQNFNGMKCSKLGVMEPQEGREKEVKPGKDTFFIVPGSVFDEKGNRFGYGGGYYDTYFEQYPQVKRVALAYEFQLWKEELTVEPHDKQMDYIITEKKILWIGGKK